MGQRIQIANPIYDVVFKYLLEDNRIAKLLISKIIETEVMELELMPKERTSELNRPPLTVYRLDFRARIKTRSGEDKTVIIEIQKAKFPTDIMRFRKYLGEQYGDTGNTYMIEENGRTVKKARPLISIYFLGHKLAHIDASVIKINRKYHDSVTGKEIAERDDFIESLTHDSYVIQIPCLKAKRRNELEQVLDVFNQEYTAENQHLLWVNETDYPKKYQGIIRRLRRAMEETDVRQTMDIEDEIIEELENKERFIETQKECLKEKEKQLELKDKTIEEKDKALEAKNTILEQKDKAMEAKDQLLAEKDRLIAELQKKLVRKE
jgi:hypothetical protein